MKIIIDSINKNAPNNAKLLPNYKNYLLNILVNLGYNFDTPPVADLLKNLHGLEGEWLVVSPVNWQATHNDSMLVAAGHDFLLNSEQSTYLFNKFSEFASCEGMSLFMHDATTWLMNVKNKPPLRSRPVYSILHNSLISELENLDESMYWQKFITMGQMLLNNLCLPNDTNQYPINGVWVWGGGCLQEKKTNEIITLDNKAHEIAEILSVNSFKYKKNTYISKDAIILSSSINNLTILPEKCLQKVNAWHWNNFSYSLPSKWNIFKAITCRFNKKS